jgi:hypothetical protein
MTRERARELLPVIQAFAEGKEIQERFIGGKDDWSDCSERGPSAPAWNSTKWEFRIKPEPREWWIMRRPGLYDLLYKSKEELDVDIAYSPGAEVIHVGEIAASKMRHKDFTDVASPTNKIA